MRTRCRRIAGELVALGSQPLDIGINVISSEAQMMQPATTLLEIRCNGPIATYLEKRGGGLHHLCFRTDDIDADVERLRAKGYQFTSDAPTPGAHGSRVIFIHPKSCDGVLIELSQPAESHA